MVAELCETVVVIGMFRDVFFPKELQGHMPACHLLLEIGQQLLEDLEVLVGVGRIATLETMLEHGVIEFEKAFYAEFICTGLRFTAIRLALRYLYLSLPCLFEPEALLGIGWDKAYT